MLWNLVVFAVIGLFVGGASRLLYPGRQPLRILGTLVLGLTGALLGGLLSWTIWPVVEGDIQYGALLLSFIGAVFGLVFWAGWAYGRSISGHTTPPGT
jgi:uncharacterized membrane protein YeaQ/YmgE (transglycosylase-associated protein family)